MVAAFLVKKFQASAIVADTEAAVGPSWLLLAQKQTRATQRIWFLYSSNSKLKHVGVGPLNQLTIKHQLQQACWKENCMYVCAVLGDTVWVSTTSRLVTSMSISDVQGSSHLCNLDVSNFLPFTPHIFTGNAGTWDKSSIDPTHT